VNQLIAVVYVAVSMACLWTVSATPACAGSSKAAESLTTVAPLMTQQLVADSSKEVVMLTVTYAPGASSSPHRHDAQVFVFMLEGTLTMQIRGHAAVTLHPGETFYESPGDIHAVSANASHVAPAKFLVVMIKDKTRPVSRPVAR